MRQAKRPGRAGERPRFSGRSNFQQGGRGEKFKAICSECGQDCYLPFKPSSHKPVYCDTCFQGHRLINPQKSSQFIAKKFPQLDQAEQLRLQEKLEMMNAKLEKILEFVSQVSRQIKELEFPQPQEIIKQAKSGAKELKKNLEDKQAKLKSIKTDTKKLGQELARC